MMHQSHQPLAFRYVGHNPDMRDKLWFLLGKEPTAVTLWSDCYEDQGTSGQTWRGDPTTATTLFHQVHQP